MKIFILIFFLSSNAFSFSLLSAKRINSKLVNEFIQKNIVESYKSIGIQPKVIFLSEKEINKRIKNGNYDAIVSKIADKGSIKYGLALSPALITDYKVYIWYLKGKPKQQKTLSIGAIHGVMAHSKAIIKNRGIFKNVKYFPNYNEMATALERNDIDGILLSNQEYNNELDHSLKKQFIKEQKELLSINLHHYLHRKHEKLFNKLQTEFLRRHKNRDLTFDDFILKSKQKGPQ